MIDNQKKHIHTTTFYVTIITTGLLGYGLVLAYAWAHLPARPVIFALYTLLALLGAATLCLYRQALTCLCTEQAEEAEAIQRIRDALLVENDVDGLPRLVVLDGQQDMHVLTANDPRYAAVAHTVVRVCPQLASLLTLHEDHVPDVTTDQS